jgi:predicted Zn-dependent peptidase
MDRCSDLSVTRAALAGRLFFSRYTNEFERGENSPQGILVQRIEAAAFDLQLGRTFLHVRELEKRLAALTPEEVKAAFGKYIDPKKLVIIRAGDFKR